MAFSDTSTKDTLSKGRGGSLSGRLQVKVSGRGSNVAEVKPVPAAGGTLHDLCPEDKAKVARLLQQVVELGQELNCLKNTKTSDEQALTERNAQLQQENAVLKRKASQMLGMLRAYQQKLQAMDTAMKALLSQQAEAKPTMVCSAAQTADPPSTAAEHECGQLHGQAMVSQAIEQWTYINKPAPSAAPTQPAARPAVPGLPPGCVQGYPVHGGPVLALPINGLPVHGQLDPSQATQLPPQASPVSQCGQQPAVTAGGSGTPGSNQQLSAWAGPGQPGVQQLAQVASDPAGLGSCPELNLAQHPAVQAPASSTQQVASAQAQPLQAASWTTQGDTAAAQRHAAMPSEALAASYSPPPAAATVPTAAAQPPSAQGQVPTGPATSAVHLPSPALQPSGQVPAALLPGSQQGQWPGTAPASHATHTGMLEHYSLGSSSMHSMVSLPFGPNVSITIQHTAPAPPAPASAPAAAAQAELPCAVQASGASASTLASSTPGLQPGPDLSLSQPPGFSQDSLCLLSTHTQPASASQPLPAQPNQPVPQHLLLGPDQDTGHTGDLASQVSQPVAGSSQSSQPGPGPVISSQTLEPPTLTLQTSQTCEGPPLCQTTPVAPVPQADLAAPHCPSSDLVLQVSEAEAARGNSELEDRRLQLLAASHAAGGQGGEGAELGWQAVGSWRPGTSSRAGALAGPRVVVARRTWGMEGEEQEVQVQDVSGPSQDALLASPVAVPPVGVVAEAAATLMRWQVEQGLAPAGQGTPGPGAGRVLRYDPAVGKNGAFYFADVPANPSDPHPSSQGSSTAGATSISTPLSLLAPPQPNPAPPPAPAPGTQVLAAAPTGPVTLTAATLAARDAQQLSHDRRLSQALAQGSAAGHTVQRGLAQSGSAGQGWDAAGLTHAPQLSPDHPQHPGAGAAQQLLTEEQSELDELTETLSDLGSELTLHSLGGGSSRAAAPAASHLLPYPQPGYAGGGMTRVTSAGPASALGLGRMPSSTPSMASLRGSSGWREPGQQQAVQQHHSNRLLHAAQRGRQAADQVAHVTAAVAAARESEVAATFTRAAARAAWAVQAEAPDDLAAVRAARALLSSPTSPARGRGARQSGHGHSGSAPALPRVGRLWTPEQQQGPGAPDSQLGVQAVMPASSNDSSGAQGAGAGGLSRTTSTGATAAAGCLGRCGAGEESGVGGSSQQPSARLVQGALRRHTPVSGGVDGSRGSTRHGSPGPGQQRPAEYAGAGVGRDEEAILMLLREVEDLEQQLGPSCTPSPAPDTHKNRARPPALRGLTLALPTPHTGEDWSAASNIADTPHSVKQLGQVEGQAGGGGAGTIRRHASLVTGSRSSRGSGASDNFTVLRATVADWLAEDMFEENDVMAAIMQQEHA